MYTTQVKAKLQNSTCLFFNRSTGRNMIMYSTEGGMDIETVAEETPHLIFTEEIDPKVGLTGFQARKVAFNLGLSGAAFKDMTKFVTALYKAYEGAMRHCSRSTQY